jgi:hypothetical protein
LEIPDITRGLKKKKQPLAGKITLTLFFWDMEGKILIHFTP